MKLSQLQKFILKQGLNYGRPKIPRKIFDKFYDNLKNPPKPKIRANIITRSLERLIDKGLIIGFGQKTQYKLFIEEIKLTNQGKKRALALLGEQTQIKFRQRK